MACYLQKKEFNTINKNKNKDQLLEYCVVYLSVDRMIHMHSFRKSASRYSIKSTERSNRNARYRIQSWSTGI